MTVIEQKLWDEIYAKNLLMAANPTIDESCCKFAAAGADRAIEYRRKYLQDKHVSHIDKSEQIKKKVGK